MAKWACHDEYGTHISGCMGWEAMRDAEIERLRALLADLRKYTDEVETALAPWVISRPSMAHMPDGWRSLKPRLDEVLGPFDAKP